MITLSTSGNSIIFTFQDNQHYLQNGTIEVPKNSLLLVTDESNMATFKKSASNDIFISALYSELGMSKSELEAWFEENATTDYGGGGGGGDITSGEVQTMIDASISGKADTDDLTAHTANTTIHVTAGDKITWDGKSDFSGSYDDLTDKPTIPTVPTSNTAFTNDAGYITEDAISGKADISAVTESINAAVSGKLDTSTFETYSGDVETALSAKLDASAYTPTDLSEYWTSAQTESAITNAVSGKQDTLVSGTNIKTINNQSLLGSGNITISGGSGSGNSVVECTQAEYDALVSAGTVDLTAFYIITDAPAVDLSGYVNTSAITSAVTSASTDSQIPTAKAVYDAIPTGGTGGGVNVVQTTGTSTTDVMSQNAVTSSLKNKGDNLMWDQISSPINYAELRLRSDSVTLSSAKLNLGDYLVYGSPVANALNITGLTSESAFTTYTASTNSRLSEDEEVTAAALNALNDNFGGLKLVKLTQQEYDDLAVKNNNTLYVII